ncbi:hypothetical protein OQ279_15890 [Salinimicrobium sp. MT39]|uniref:Acyltransferase n=1 Tax=Salinimicrobium profundisediminis TaxID=2994553 RepID=A0A9X3I2H1_9FLAO|nr:MBOAT family O-acyltransferase [Salinimicrobium profundisediminis]MCX2839629.1 hypothetical protein [Salinimicrobium profundisediminis]
MNINLSDYVKKRNGVSMGSRGSLRNNLSRSFGAKNFSTFWTYWNPIFGYYLGKFIFKPSKRIFPASIALVITFLVSGLIHDTVTVLLRGKTSFFFTVWFLLMSFAVLLTKILKHNWSKQSWLVRALNNFIIIVLCLLLTIWIL